jgi:hypothetical protein
MIGEVSLYGTKLVGIEDYENECSDPILYCGVSDGACRLGVAGRWRGISISTDEISEDFYCAEFLGPY